MQLKNSSKIAIAAAGLLGIANISTLSAAEWDHEAAVLYYGESDDRVQDTSIKYKGKRTTDNDNVFSLNFGVDTLSGASPSGIAPSGDAQTFTSPSGTNVVYEANELTLDNAFRDTRVDLAGSWDRSIIDDNTRANIGVSVSKEDDYLHTGLSAGISREFNNKDTTLSLGVAYSADTVELEGNLPTPFADINAAAGSASDESKDTVDVVVGLTQILSKNSILQMNYGVSKADGYLNDPYKRISRVNSSGIVEQNINESRPDKRLGHNIYGALKQNFSGNVLSTSARLHTDDFGIDSITLDARYNIKLGKKSSIEPHIRYYHQTAADFYAPQLDSSAALPEFASSDYRLAEFDAYTIGATYRFKSDEYRQWRITAELYSQNPTKTELTLGQAGLEANPGFDAAVISIGLKF